MDLKLLKLSLAKLVQLKPQTRKREEEESRGNRRGGSCLNTTNKETAKCVSKTYRRVGP